ncbi:MAG TPA: acyl-CoA carboxylase epsilon subunit [Acidimicrobiales bacterium]|nr:acyl-CoA carboxylase epsilon subunit [Acidimicrobiales bacterium]
MATSPSEGDRPGAPTPDEVAAVMAALEVVLGPGQGEPPPTPAWRWSGRRWQSPERRRRQAWS